MVRSLSRVSSYLLFFLAFSCARRDGTEDSDAAIGPDADGAADVLTSDGPFQWTFAPSNVPLDALGDEPPGDLVLGAATCGAASKVEIDTDAGEISVCPGAVAGMNFRFATIEQAAGGRVAIFVARSIQIAAGMSVVVRGQLPVVLVATEDVVVSGELSAAGEGSRAGAGGFEGIIKMTGSGAGPGGGRGDGIGGGGGASYCGRGGRGGSGNDAGMFYGNARIAPLIGGSSGANAGPYYSGGGGGAIQLVAGRMIRVANTGFIHVGGGGGEQEGGGGGSGGAILLEAPMVVVGGLLAANGGGGGSGAKFGSDATPDDQPAPGGEAALLNAGEGGNGAAGLMLDGTDGQLNPTYANGEITGGGGGGAGFIRINTRAATVTSRLSPAFGTPCATQGRLD